jgi:uncharacterized membrane protein YfcA
MGSCAFLMPVASVRFVRSRRYDPRAALGLTLGGVPAVFVAAYLVTSLPLGAVKWLVVGVVVYTATAMLNSARKTKNATGRSATATGARVNATASASATATATAGERPISHD